MKYIIAILCSIISPISSLKEVTKICINCKFFTPFHISNADIFLLYINGEYNR